MKFLGHHAPISNAFAKRRRAFTLVELLVVIAIIGILVGLLLPAVQAAREAARRCSCMNNMLQVGLALHHYEYNREHLPSGVINDKGPINNDDDGQHISWIVNILPYFEQGPIYRNIDQKIGAYAIGNEEARSVAIAALQCPSDSIQGSVYGAVSSTPSSSYAGCYHSVEAPIDSDNNGLLFLNSRIRYNEILDGSSNTILVGEKIAAGVDRGWMSGTRATLRNTGSFTLPPKRTRRNGVIQEMESPDPSVVGGFGSLHSAGANFTFADGSVRYLSLDIEPDLYQNLGDRNDGAMIGGTFY
jgi:prepilin-type N-terminal cleavage/methylation domain-containing protein/prepilin-type processing-associated H-X9-DG protein